MSFMDNKFSFENLEVYKRGLKFATELCEIAYRFPYQYGRLRDQLIGAAISFPFNIAEGSGRYSRKDKIHFYKIARASIFECVSILTISNNLGLINNSILTRYKQEALELSKMTAGLIRNTK
jgi:four helix bundle protein